MWCWIQIGMGVGILILLVCAFLEVVSKFPLCPLSLESSFLMGLIRRFPCIHHGLIYKTFHKRYATKWCVSHSINYAKQCWQFSQLLFCSLSIALSCSIQIKTGRCEEGCFCGDNYKVCCGKQETRHGHSWLSLCLGPDCFWNSPSWKTIRR